LQHSSHEIFEIPDTTAVFGGSLLASALLRLGAPPPSSRHTALFRKNDGFIEPKLAMQRHALSRGMP